MTGRHANGTSDAAGAQGAGVSLRVAGAEDAELLARLIREACRDVAARFSLTADNCPKHPSHCAPDWVAADQARGVQYFVLEESGEPVGCVALELPRLGLCYVERLAVLPGYRRRGHGRALMQHALARARASGVARASIGIIAAYDELRQWYVDLEFVETGRKRFDHLPFEVCFMERDLSEDRQR